MSEYGSHSVGASDLKRPSAEGPVDAQTVAGEQPVAPEKLMAQRDLRSLSGSRGVLSRSDTATRIRVLQQLQRSHGNAYVQRLMADMHYVPDTRQTVEPPKQFAHPLPVSHGQSRSLQRDLAGVSSAMSMPAPQGAEDWGAMMSVAGNQSYMPASPAPAQDRLKLPRSVAEMSTTEKLAAAIERALPKMPGEARERIKELLEPESLAFMAGFMAVYVASQLTPAGWIADIIAGGLVVASVLMMGPEVLEIVKHISQFVEKAMHASSEADLDAAGDHLAIAVTKIGVDIVVALLLHKAGKSGKAALPKIKAGIANLAAVDMVTADGLVIRNVPPDALPDNVAAMKAEPGKAASTTESGTNATESTQGQAPKAKRTPIGRILFEGRVGNKVVIKSIVDSPPGRLGYEKLLPRGVEVGLEGWERAHSQGQITGAESAEGVRYAPSEVNQEFQKGGIEQFISDLNEQKAADTTIYLTTETETHPGSLRLKSITYKVEAALGKGEPSLLYEATIEIENETKNPTIDISAKEYGDVERFLKPLPAKKVPH